LIVEKDVVLAILGSSAALAGFVLVFLGVIIASYQSYSGAVPEQVVGPFRTLGRTFDLDAFPAMLERGISSTHPDMPVFKFSQDDAHDVVVYLRSIQR